MSRIRHSSVALGLSLTAALLVEACTTNTFEGDVHNHYGLGGDGGAGGAGGAPAATGGSGPETRPPRCDAPVPLDELDIDLFGRDGHLFYFEVTPEQRELADLRTCDGGAGGPIFGEPGIGFGNGVYDLGGEKGCPPYATNVRIVPAGSKECADTGKVELELPGQSSFRPWSDIPNFKLDVNEFSDQAFPSGHTTIRLNNGQADSTIVREATALPIWRALGYPAPKTRFVKTMSNVWDLEFRPGTFAAHVLVETYKGAFFEAAMPEVTDVWEGAQDPFAEWGGGPLECQWASDDECDDLALAAVQATVGEAPRGPGFMTATESVIDWPRLFENQCLAALTGTGDDWIHNSNNLVLALDTRGKVTFLPYSTDISGGHPWYQDVSFDGTATLTMRCAEDPECRSASLDRCEEMIDEFVRLDVPTTIVKKRCDDLAAAGLEREPDEAVCKSLESYYQNRPEALRAEIERLRSGGGPGGAGGADGAGGGLVFPL